MGFPKLVYLKMAKKIYKKALKHGFRVAKMKDFLNFKVLKPSGILKKKCTIPNSIYYKNLT
jgi:hypothetical protein